MSTLVPMGDDTGSSNNDHQATGAGKEEMLQEATVHPSPGTRAGASGNLPPTAPVMNTQSGLQTCSRYSWPVAQGER